jgi:hypothetical protein
MCIVVTGYEPKSSVSLLIIKEIKNEVNSIIRDKGEGRIVKSLAIAYLLSLLL